MTIAIKCENRNTLTDCCTPLNKLRMKNKEKELLSVCAYT